VTSPTGIREIQRLSGIDIAALTIDAIEKQHPVYASNSIAQ
jgi:glutathione synthase/RimK-type ligase-like ATP-grasp enzyme